MCSGVLPGKESSGIGFDRFARSGGLPQFDGSGYVSLLCWMTRSSSWKKLVQMTVSQHETLTSEWLGEMAPYPVHSTRLQGQHRSFSNLFYSSYFLPRVSNLTSTPYLTFPTAAPLQTAPHVSPSLHTRPHRSAPSPLVLPWQNVDWHAKRHIGSVRIRKVSLVRVHFL